VPVIALGRLPCFHSIDAKIFLLRERTDCARSNCRRASVTFSSNTTGKKSNGNGVSHTAAAASLAACRTTQRPAEMKIADTLIGAILDAGFEGRTAARVYRAIADFSLAGAGGEAAFLALETRLQENDRAAWMRAYRAVDPAEHPHIWQLREELPAVTDDDIFETILSLVIGGLT